MMCFRQVLHFRVVRETSVHILQAIRQRGAEKSDRPSQLHTEATWPTEDSSAIGFVVGVEVR